MGVRDHQVHPVQTTGFQTREEVLPELEGLTLADRGTEHLASPGRRHPVATTNAWETTWAPTRTLQNVASQNTYGNSA